MNMIFSADRNWGIGCGNKLLFRVSADMKRFRKLTGGKVVVMGYNTFLSLPDSKPLPKRVNIVLSRKQGLTIEGVTVCSGFDELFREISAYPKDDVFVIGGEQIYKQLMPYCEKAYVTRFDAEARADSFMENLDENPQWKMVDTSEKYEDNGLEYIYATYVNKKGFC